MGDDSPVQESAERSAEALQGGSHSFVPKAAPQGLLRWHCQPLLAVLGKIFRCEGMKPLSDGLGIHCPQAEIFLIIA